MTEAPVACRTPDVAGGAGPGVEYGRAQGRVSRALGDGPGVGEIPAAVGSLRHQFGSGLAGAAVRCRCLSGGLRIPIAVGDGSSIMAH